jgi:predicted nucleic acid-binding protein
MERLAAREFRISLSVPLVLEYEDAGKRSAREAGLTASDVDDVVDYLCSVADLREIHFLWRPCLRDPYDDHLLELAVESGSRWIVTFNIRDFVGSERFGVVALTPQQFLAKLEGSR